MLKFLFLFLAIHSFAEVTPVSETDLAFQKKVMDEFADAGIILYAGPHRNRDQWEKIAKSKDVIIRNLQGKINLVKEGTIGLSKVANMFNVPNDTFDTLTDEKIQQALARETSGEFVRDLHYKIPIKALDNLPPDAFRLRHPITQKWNEFIYSHGQVKIIPGDVKDFERRELYLVDSVHQFGIILKGVHWGKLHAFMPAEYSDYRFIVTNFEPGNIPLERLILDVRVETLSKPKVNPGSP
jgi:hypothetical protein